MAIGMWPFDQSHSLCKLWPQCVASPSFALERCTRCNPATHRQLPAGWPNSPPWVTMFDPQHPWTASETRESFPKKWATWNHPVKKGLKIKINYIYIHSYIYTSIYIYILLYITIYIYSMHFETTNQLLHAFATSQLSLLWTKTQVPDLRDSSAPAEISCRYQVSDLRSVGQEVSKCGSLATYGWPSTLW